MKQHTTQDTSELFLAGKSAPCTMMTFAQHEELKNRAGFFIAICSANGTLLIYCMHEQSMNPSKKKRQA